jgi:hypothetical protein
VSSFFGHRLVYLKGLGHDIELKHFDKSAVSFSPILFGNGLAYISRDFYEKANQIQGPRTNFTVSPRHSNTFSDFEKYVGTRTMDQ